jgi:hypothetical protein
VRGWITLAVAVALMFGAAAPARGDTVVLLHPGGFGFEDPSRMAMAADTFRAQGLGTIYADYPLGDPMAAWRHVRDLVAERSIDFAYGESAGAILAANLGVRGKVRRAVSNSGACNLTTTEADSWMQVVDMGPSEREFLSANLQGPSPQPVLTILSPEDLGYFTRSCSSWADRDPRVHPTWASGGHIYGSGLAEYQQLLDRAARFLTS